MRFEAFVVASLALAGCQENQTHPPDHQGYGGSDAGMLDCVPNLDGAIDANELKTVLNVSVNYLVSPGGETRTVDVAGKAGGDGKPVWDFASDYASDRKLTIEAVPLTNKWYAASFPEGQFATPVDAARTIEGVYSSDESGIRLLGLASATEMPPEGKTLLVYASPVLVYKLPLVAGSSWVSTGEVKDATVRGLPYAGKDIYEIADDATGELRIPNLTFKQAHRVRTHLTTMPAAGAAVSTRQASYVFECFGEVARVTSAQGEPNDDFTTAAEMRRLGQ